MAEAFIVDATRTPLGRRNGSLAHAHPADLSAVVMRETLARAKVDPHAVDDVIWGCLDQVGPQAHDIARTAWLAAGLPEHVPGVTIDRQCGSSQQALHFAAQAVMSGTQDLVLAGGVQSMSMVPMNSSINITRELYGPNQFSGCKGWRDRYGDQEISQFMGAELVCDRWNLSRSDLEAFALVSNERAVEAIGSGRFKKETTPVATFTTDETPRAGTTLEKMAALKTVREGGKVTAASSSQISDGAAAILVASVEAVRTHGLIPRARIHQMTVLGDDPVAMLTAPIAATRRALKRSGMRINDIDLVEINEAFAPIVLAWTRELEADPDRVNVNGGAIALGHPLGASGARLMTTLLHELERRNGRYGLQTMCEAGGQANVTIIERI